MQARHLSRQQVQGLTHPSRLTGTGRTTCEEAAVVAIVDRLVPNRLDRGRDIEVLIDPVLFGARVGGVVELAAGTGLCWAPPDS